MTVVRSPTVTVVLPVLNEESDVAGCIAAIAAQEYPPELIEVIVVDGDSTDATVSVVAETAARLGLHVTVLHNPRRQTSISLNLGLESAAGEVLVRVDARSRVASTYVRRCVDALESDPSIGVVGGAQVPTARSSALRERAIARSLRNRYATGFSRYRLSRTSGPSDTVWMGVFRTEELRALGGWSDRVAINEDWELSARYRAASHIVWFLADERSGYLPRTTYRQLARQHYHFGRTKGMWWVRGMRPAARQIIILVVPPVVAVVFIRSLWRRGPRVLWQPVAALAVLDAVGCREPADPPERIGSIVAIALYASAWWVGVVAGAVGEVFGAEHEHWSPMP